MFFILGPLSFFIYIPFLSEETESTLVLIREFYPLELSWSMTCFFIVSVLTSISSKLYLAINTEWSVQWLALSLVMILGLYATTLKNNPNDATTMATDNMFYYQKKEIQGLFALVVVVLGYVNQSRLFDLFHLLPFDRIIISLLLFITAHDTFTFLKTSVSSPSLLLRQLIQLNLSSLLVCTFLGDSIRYYYIAPYLSVWVIGLYIYHIHSPVSSSSDDLIQTWAMICFCYQILAFSSFWIYNATVVLEYKYKPWIDSILYLVSLDSWSFFAGIFYVIYEQSRMQDQDLSRAQKEERWIWNDWVDLVQHFRVPVISLLGLLGFVQAGISLFYQTWLHNLFALVPVLFVVHLRQVSPLSQWTSPWMAQMGESSLDFLVLSQSLFQTAHGHGKLMVHHSETISFIIMSMFIVLLSIRFKQNVDILANYIDREWSKYIYKLVIAMFMFFILIESR